MNIVAAIAAIFSMLFNGLAPTAMIWLVRSAPRPNRKKFFPLLHPAAVAAWPLHRDAAAVASPELPERDRLSHSTIDLEKKMTKKMKGLGGILGGALLGFAYYFFIGCRSGSCPISGNPIISTIYGGVVGALVFLPGRSRKKAD